MIDLSGTWLGTYWQDGRPTRFEATLVQGGSTLSGRILDDGHLGEAQIDGEVAGHNVQFTKRYLTSSAYSIRYRGKVSEEGNYMSGEWSIALLDSGPWEARRSGDNLVAELETRLEQEAEAEAPAEEAPAAVPSV